MRDVWQTLSVFRANRRHRLLSLGHPLCLQGLLVLGALWQFFPVVVNTGSAAIRAIIGKAKESSGRTAAEARLEIQLGFKPKDSICAGEKDELGCNACCTCKVTEPDQVLLLCPVLGEGAAGAAVHQLYEVTRVW